MYETQSQYTVPVVISFPRFHVPSVVIHLSVYVLDISLQSD